MSDQPTLDKEMEELTPPQCRDLLGQHHLGRIAFLERAGVMPVVFPVNYTLLGSSVVFRSDPGSKLTAALHTTPVAFEIDGVDPRLEVGWSVLVRGFVTEVTDRTELQRLRSTPMNAWAPGKKGHFLKIETRQLTGRRIGIAPLPSAWWG
jgi:nitroimidazol reductase NimA-like FMN-containing flavoprotein (pyridoxamine 5'-phosphate oxidase superfamily)